METLWLEAIKQVPGLAVVSGVLVWIVSRFLNHIRAAEERQDRLEEGRSAALDKVVAHCEDESDKNYQRFVELTKGALKA